MITREWSDEGDHDECLPLTSCGAVQLADGIRALTDRAKAQCQTDNDVHALLKEVSSCIVLVSSFHPAHTWGCVHAPLMITLVVQSNLLRESLLAGITDHALLLRSLNAFVSHGGIVALVHVLANCLAAPCQLQWAAYESFGQQGLMRTAHILEVIGKEENRDVWRQVPPADQTSVIGVLIHIMETTMQVCRLFWVALQGCTHQAVPKWRATVLLLQGRFVDMRMQDSYTILRTLQDLCCLGEHTAGVFLACCGLSNLCSVVSWPRADMRHVRWAAVSFLKEVRQGY